LHNHSRFGDPTASHGKATELFQGLTIVPPNETILAGTTIKLITVILECSIVTKILLLDLKNNLFKNV
jgi:hypothetical protein